MVNKLRELYDPKITLGNIITLTVIIISFLAGYVRLQVRQEILESEVAAQTRKFKEHEEYDDKRFADYATRESRMQRDKQVDATLSEILDRVKRIEVMHMR